MGYDLHGGKPNRNKPFEFLVSGWFMRKLLFSLVKSRFNRLFSFFAAHQSIMQGYVFVQW
jgi:hypothetical protein